MKPTIGNFSRRLVLIFSQHSLRSPLRYGASTR
jgi:hypothetical protein